MITNKIIIQIIWQDDIIEYSFNYNRRVIKFLNKNSLHLYKQNDQENYTYDFSYKPNCYIYICRNIFNLIYLEQEHIKYYYLDYEYLNNNKKYAYFENIEYYL